MTPSSCKIIQMLCVICSVVVVVSLRKCSKSGVRCISSLHENAVDGTENDFMASLLSASKPIKERFFFPGHAGGKNAPERFKIAVGDNVLAMDLPELDETDNLHKPEGLLMRALEEAARLFGARRTWFLINGSTSGIQIAILACVQIYKRVQWLTRRQHGNAVPTGHKGGPIMIVGRDSHKSVFDAIALAQCEAVLIPCHVDEQFGIPLSSNLAFTEQALKDYGDQVCGVLITRPSYQGVAHSTERLTRLATLCHAAGVPLVVDEAHGAHLRFLHQHNLSGAGCNTPSIAQSPHCRMHYSLLNVTPVQPCDPIILIHVKFNLFPSHPSHALGCGADVVIQSTHKTLTSLSQTAMLHLGKDAFPFLNTASGAFGVTEGAGGAAGTSGPGGLTTNQIDAASVIQQYFSMLTTTSPNAILLASLDTTRQQMACEGDAMVRAAAEAASDIRQAIRTAGNVSSADADVDRSNTEIATNITTSPSEDHEAGEGGEGGEVVCSVRLLDDAPMVLALGLVVDPLRLSVQFEGSDAVDVDDKMCSDEGIYCELNLSRCISYALPVGSTSHSLRTLKQSLLGQTTTRHRQKRNLKAHEGNMENNALSLRERDEIGNKEAKEVVEVETLGTSQPLGHIVGAVDGDIYASPVVMVAVNGEIVGKVAAETVCSYPPGIPLVIRGEILTPWHITTLCDLAAALRSEDEKKNVQETISINGDDIGIGDVCGRGESRRGYSAVFPEVDKDALETRSDRFGSGRLVTGCSDPTLSTLAVFDIY